MAAVHALTYCGQKYSSHRDLLNAKVALGKSAELTKVDTSLNAPPAGYDSVHGVR